MSETSPLVVVVGGAVAGSEAVSLLEAAGHTVVCLEQNDLPYGKIEDGLPRWHHEQRLKEAQKINERLNKPNVHFVPNTKVGRDLEIQEILSWNPSAVLLANGAWKDRPLPVEGIDAFVEKGFFYQNPFVHWFNHFEEPTYQGPQITIPDGPIVIGGGLASLDVLKICQIQLVRGELSRRGISLSVLEIEKEGIDKALAHHNLTYEGLGLKGATLYFRRRVEDMSLAEIDASASAEQKAKVGALRAKILNNYQSKFKFNVVTERLPVKVLSQDGRLTGMVFQATQQEGHDMRLVPNTFEEVHTSLVISSIGSIPEPIAGLPLKGERYDIEDWDVGSVKGMPGVFVLGNALTGKGNIRVSMVHSREVVKKLLGSYFQNPATLRSSAERSAFLTQIRALQTKVGYHDFTSWVETHSRLKA